MERFGGGLSCRKRTDFAYSPRQRDRGYRWFRSENVVCMSIFGGRAGRGGGFYLWLGEGLKARYGRDAMAQNSMSNRGVEVGPIGGTTSSYAGPTPL